MVRNSQGAANPINKILINSKFIYSLLIFYFYNMLYFLCYTFYIYIIHIEENFHLFFMINKYTEEKYKYLYKNKKLINIFFCLLLKIKKLIKYFFKAIFYFFSKNSTKICILLKMALSLFIILFKPAIITKYVRLTQFSKKSF